MRRTMLSASIALVVADLMELKSALMTLRQVSDNVNKKGFGVLTRAHRPKWQDRC